MNFISILKDIGRVFTSPVAEKVEAVVLPTLGTVFPGFGPLITGISDAVGVIQKSSLTTPASDTQKLATALTLGEQLFADFETASGIKVPAGNQANIVSYIVSILNEIPSTTASAKE